MGSNDVLLMLLMFMTSNLSISGAYSTWVCLGPRSQTMTELDMSGHTICTIVRCLTASPVFNSSQNWKIMENLQENPVLDGRDGWFPVEN